MTAADPASLIHRKTGSWWTDDRRNWCAYCGTAILRSRQNKANATRDHVIPRAHKGRHVTIPCCKPCNAAKAAQSLPEFMLSRYFETVRSKPSERRWPLRDLWLVVALAAVEQAREHENARPPAKKVAPS